MNELKEALAKLEEAKQMLSEAIKNSLGHKTILSGKCAIAVNNEREFKLLMDDYSKKNWKTFTGLSVEKITDVWSKSKYPMFITYNDGFESWYNRCPIETIPFSDFAAEVGITVPVFVMNSEDGVPLYEGDKYSVAHRSYTGNKWALLSFRGDCTYSIETNSVCLESERFFSTKEAAEAWIKEQNKPKFTDVELFGGDAYSLVYKDQIEIFKDGNCIVIKPSDLEDMLHAYKSLQ